MDMERLENSSDEVSDGRSNAMVEKKRVERVDWMMNSERR